MSDEDTNAGAPESAPSRYERKLARRVAGFAARHGGADASVAHVGRGVTRIVLVGKDDGAWGDVVARSADAAAGALRGAPGVDVREALDGAVALRMHSGAYEWRRMAGLQVGGR